jgi:hypothetical protein
VRIARQLGLSRATVSRVLRRLGLNRILDLEPLPAVVRYEHAAPGDLLHLDIKRLVRWCASGGLRTASPATVATASRASVPSSCTSPSMTTRGWLYLSLTYKHRTAVQGLCWPLIVWIDRGKRRHLFLRNRYRRLAYEPTDAFGARRSRQRTGESE